MTKDKENDKDEGKMTVEEAGRKGGEAVIEKYGPEHMAEIGRKGGEHSHGGHNNDDDNNNRGKSSNKKDNGGNSNRGLASADKETRERVAKKGGES
jgi:general stress protein YciG